MKWFEHTMPIHSSSMSRWRKRIGDKGAEQLLQQTITDFRAFLTVTGI